MTEFGVHHICDTNTWISFKTLTEAIEWVSEHEQPNDWRLYERDVTEWEEIE